MNKMEGHGNYIEAPSLMDTEAEIANIKKQIDDLNRRKELISIEEKNIMDQFKIGDGFSNSADNTAKMMRDNKLRPIQNKMSYIETELVRLLIEKEEFEKIRRSILN